ncbi:MAG TPA: protein-disulfide reductase DsbD domain-containing protein [Caulobacteraceae bacterium]
MRRLLFLIAAILALSGLALATPTRAPHVTAELAAQTVSAAPAGNVNLAVVLTADKGWHTYWRNPGDAGAATQIAWTLPPGWSAGAIVWPAPKRLPLGPIMNYGYEGQTVLVAPLAIPASAPVGQSAPIAAKVDYLVCAQVCVPGTVHLSLDLPVRAVAGPPDPKFGALIAETLAASPKPGAMKATFQRGAARLSLAIAGAPLAGRAARDAYFYPYSDNLIDQSKPQAIERGPSGLILSMTPGAAFAAGAKPPGAFSGVLTVDDLSWEVTAAAGPPPAGAASVAPDYGRVALALGAALLGGLILNLMPCVFPILAMKAAALAKAGDGGARGEGLAFFAGVVATFLMLAAALVAAKAAGEAVGWGFQLQSPLNVALLALVMLAAGLNLSGLFEIGSSVQGLGGGVSVQGRLLGSALTGALAVVVAAPCTAPFMGPALGFAFTQPPAIALAVFLALAIGFAAPFTVLAVVPALTSRLPRPGPWMEGFRKLLAFPMYAAAAWLLWVMSQQTGPVGLARLLAAAIALAFAAWLFGVGQRRRASRGGGWTPTFAAAASLILGLAAVSVGPFEPPAAVAAPAGSLAPQPWSPERQAALRAAGTPVLVNFTAAWCVTCQVNERTAFASPAVAIALHRVGAAYLVADWTNRNPKIAAALAEQGRIGVPLYLYYPKGAAAPKVLPQLLTPQILVDAVSG